MLTRAERDRATRLAQRPGYRIGDIAADLGVRPEDVALWLFGGDGETDVSASALPLGERGDAQRRGEGRGTEGEDDHGGAEDDDAGAGGSAPHPGPLPGGEREAGGAGAGPGGPAAGEAGAAAEAAAAGPAADADGDAAAAGGVGLAGAEAAAPVAGGGPVVAVVAAGVAPHPGGVAATPLPQGEREGGAVQESRLDAGAGGGADPRQAGSGRPSPSAGTGRDADPPAIQESTEEAAPAPPLYRLAFSPGEWLDRSGVGLTRKRDKAWVGTAAQYEAIFRRKPHLRNLEPERVIS